MNTKYDFTLADPPDVKADAYARVSPDGRLLAFSLERPPVSGNRFLRVVELGTGRVLLDNEPGFDPFWSPTGDRVVFISREPTPQVAIWYVNSRQVRRGIAPYMLGDYPSWANHNGKDMIVTVLGNYYYLENDTAVLPHATLAPCRPFDPNARPLVSKDGELVSIFVEGELIVRTLRDCSKVIKTGVIGAKADFSWNGRYIAFHAPKQQLSGTRVLVYDLVAGSLLPITDLPGNSYFPSWTRDGRLVFRYESSDYRGFVTASDFLLNPPLKGDRSRISKPEGRAEALGIPEQYHHGWTLLLMFSTWGAHCLRALEDFAVVAQMSLSKVTALAAAAPSSNPAIAEQMLNRAGIKGLVLHPTVDAAVSSGVLNQVPAYILLHEGSLVSKKLGAQTPEELVMWIRQCQRGACDGPKFSEAATTIKK